MHKICYFNLATYSKAGGIENYNKTFLKALDGFDQPVSAVSVYDHEIKEKFKNIDVRNFKGNKIKASLYLLRHSHKINCLIVAHINLLPIAIFAKILKPSLTIYLSIYGIEVWKKLPFIYRYFFNYMSIFSISNYTTNMFAKMNGLAKDKIYYLPPDTNLLVHKNFDNIYKKDRFNLLSVTRLVSDDSYKGVDSVLSTIPLLIKKIPNLHYTIVGKGDDAARLASLVKTLQIEEYVDFKGFVEDTEPYYQYCDVFVLPSKGEGFGIVYIEAMKHQKPCIACNEGGQTDVVINNETGYLCEYDDIESLAEKILSLYEDKDKIFQFGQNGYQHLIDNFTFEKFKERLAAILLDGGTNSGSKKHGKEERI